MVLATLASVSTKFAIGPLLVASVFRWFDHIASVGVYRTPTASMGIKSQRNYAPACLIAGKAAKVQVA
eukprot:3696708-Amphidinium_carterae.1